MHLLALHPLDISARFADAADQAIRHGIAIAILVAVAFVVRWLLHRIVDRLVKQAETGVLPNRLTGRFTEALADRMSDRSANAARRVQRAKTMGDLLKSVITGVVFAIFGTMVLDQLGINIAPILASAGIIGIALGFGAQSLVKDYLSGIFMIFEDQYGVGDVVDVGSASGTVEAVSLRVTRLRALDGTVWYVPNGEILRVGNQSQNWARAVIDVTVGYQEDLTRVRRVLAEVAHGLWEDEEFASVIIEEPEVTGVEALTADGVTIRVLVKTQPLEQWAVARELRARIKARLEFEHIEIPVGQRVVWHQDTTSAPPDDDEPGTGTGTDSVAS
ncbi:MAG: mechanosensitive ion channel family protein [Nocardioides sp.]|uniref:mechanosensitive ion channel family protein n=1 Tax=Nocardioides sp. TaxID=35761 RepID=UPI0039E49236